MIDAVRRAPAKYNYASVGSGSPHHLFMETLKTESGLEIQHIPYKGTAAAITDLLTGQVQAHVRRRDPRDSEHPVRQARGARDLVGTQSV
jgi:tripartite-type tricarboxylate transporter receptor subunit TctC